MGRVTFNGDIATPESQAFIRRAEQAIYGQRDKDEFVLAREVELLYRENGLEPGTFIRAGSQDVARNGGYSGDRGAYGAPRYRSGGTIGQMIRDAVGWAAGFLVLLVALGLMKLWGLG